MTRFKLFRIKNAMLFSNFISNLVGVAVVLFWTERSGTTLSTDILELAHRINTFYLPLSFLLPWAFTLLYERPIRSYLRLRNEQRHLTGELVLKAQQRLLNEPFFLIALALGTWLTAAMVYSGMFWAHGAALETIRGTFLRSFYTGLITTTVAFFVSEYVLQRRLAPLFFPTGGLSMTPGTLRIRIRTRLIALLLASNLIPLIIILDGIWKLSATSKDLYQTLQQFQSNMLIEILLFMSTSMWLTFLVSTNLTKPLGEITHVLQKIKTGLFESKVRVTSNDEIGYTGDVINEMTEGLMERDQLQQSLALAKEIQENLLPREYPKIAGFDIAGKSVYCDETGGDYYDFIHMGSSDSRKAGVVIADVSGHGIASALLMATVRSSLRQRASLPESTAQIIAAVNRQLAKDVEHSGDFVTMFFLTIDTANHELEWVCAGHDPAVVYDPGTDAFEELGGSGIALGIDEEWTYHANKRDGFSNGQVIFVGTDGVWEVRNKEGDMLGKEPILEVIRKNHSSSSQAILAAILDTVARYQDGARKEDDVTLVIIKAMPQGEQYV
jgi:phosphoserine phosphatase RsbU/P